MLRSVGSKVAWVGRTASMVFGLALVLALVLGVASMAFGANGQNFILGKLNNAATKVTGLVGNVDGAAALRVTNPNAGTNDTALDLRVQTGEAPMRVNSNTRVANLNAATAGRADSAASADNATNAQNAATLDGKDSTEFLGKTEQAANSDTLDGKDSTEFLGRTEKAADSDTLDGKDSTQFVKGFSGAVSVDPPSVAANSCATSSVTVNGVNKGDVVFLTPTLNFTFSNSLTLMTHREVNNDNKIFYTVCNVGNSSVDAPTGSWGFLVARQF